MTTERKAATGSPNRRQTNPHIVQLTPRNWLVFKGADICRSSLRRNNLLTTIPVGHMHSDPDIATCMYYTGLDPITNKSVAVAKAMHDRKLQRALMQFFKPPGERGAGPPNPTGYRPRRKSAKRRQGKKQKDGLGPTP